MTNVAANVFDGVFCALSLPSHVLLLDPVLLNIGQKVFTIFPSKTV